MALPLLKGVRVLELALLMPADHVAGILGDLGAEVIKVEQPPNGDYVRELGGVLAPGISEFHLFFTATRRALLLNLRTEEGQKVFHELLKTTDVVYESGVPSARKRLRADYESCKATKPDIIYALLPGLRRGQHLQPYPCPRLGRGSPQRQIAHRDPARRTAEGWEGCGRQRFRLGSCGAVNRRGVEPPQPDRPGVSPGYLHGRLLHL